MAVWFWLPLLSEWFGGEDAGPHSAAAVAAPPATAPLAAVDPPGGAAPAAGVPPIDWRTLAQWKQTNAFAKPFVWQEGMRNPFVAKVIEIDNTAVDAAEQLPAAEQQIAREVVEQKLASEVASLQLTSTLIVPRGRWATINGVNYQQGDSIKIGSQAEEAAATGDFPAAADQAESTSTQFVIEQIEAQSVTLRAGTQYYPLNMKRPANNAIRLELR